MIVEAVTFYKNVGTRAFGDGEVFSFSKKEKVGWGEKEQVVWYNFSCNKSFYEKRAELWVKNATVLVSGEIGGYAVNEKGELQIYINNASVKLDKTPVWDGVPRNNGGATEVEIENEYETDDIPF